MAKRRGDGEGSIYQVREKLWRAEISIGYKPDGKANRKVLYGKTRAEVAGKLKEKLRDQQLGQNLKPGSETVGTFLNRWLEDTVSTRNRPQTARSYRWIVTSHLVPSLGRHRLELLSPQHVQQFLAERHATGLSAATVKHIRATLRAALSQAERWGLVHRNVAKLVDVPRAQRYQAAVLTPDDGMTLLRHLASHPREALYVTALTMGLRRGELLGLRWCDVDLMGFQMNIRAALFKGKGVAAVLAEPKSERAVRKLRIPRVCAEALGRWRVIQKAERRWAGKRWVDQDFVFTNGTGGPLSPDGVTRELPKILATAELPVVRLHDLRHSCATMLLAMGVHPKLVQETMGHSTFQLTMDTYSHVIPALQNEVADRIDAALTPTPTQTTTHRGSSKVN